MYTMSASSNPICGWAAFVSSIFTASTRPSTPSRPLRTLVAFFAGSKSDTTPHPVRAKTKTIAEDFLKNIRFEFISNR